MPSATENKPAPILDPLDRNAEILFGLFMCLTFTGTLGVATAGREDVRMAVAAAIGCNAAWGMVDGVMYILRSLVTRGHLQHVGRSVRRTRDAGEGRALIANEFDPQLIRAIGEEGVERIRAAVIAAPEPLARPRLQWQEVRAAIVVFLLVFLSTFPVVLPFVFIAEIQTAKRVSAAVAIVLMFACGYTWGKHAGQSPLRVGSVMVFLGVVIEAAIIALGG